MLNSIYIIFSWLMCSKGAKDMQHIHDIVIAFI